MNGARVPRFVHRHRSALTISVGLAVIMTVQGIASSAMGAGAASVAPPNGRLWASNCAQCHGTNGMNGSFDQLAGIPVESMMEKMHDQQTHSSIMGAQARGYTEAELLSIATYFASLPKP